MAEVLSTRKWANASRLIFPYEGDEKLDREEESSGFKNEDVLVECEVTSRDENERSVAYQDSVSCRACITEDVDVAVGLCWVRA